jgi:tetratricopeptide (TPR) repeat protein/DNA-binding CsgD family transcriptional regulator
MQWREGGSAVPSSLLHLERMTKELEKEIGAIKKTEAPELRLSRLLEITLKIYRNEPQASLELSEKALQLAKKLKDRSAEARSWWRIACANSQLSEYPPALEALEHARSIFGDLNDRKGLASVLRVEGSILREMGRLQDAFAKYRECLNIRRELGMKLDSSDVLVEMGIAAQELGNYSEALDHHYEALRLFDGLHESLRQSIVLTNIGNVYHEVRDFDKAESFYMQALALERTLGDDRGIAAIQLNRASIFQERRALTEALACYEESISLSRRMGNVLTEAAAISCKAQMSFDEGDLKAALQLFETAAKLAEKHSILNFGAESRIGMAKVLVALKKEKQAIPIFEAVLKLISPSGHLRLRCDTHSHLAKALVVTGDLANAVKHFDQFIEINSSLNSQDHHRAVAEVQARIEIEKADRERARLESEKAALEQDAEVRAKELTALALQIVQKNEFLADLREEIAPTLGATSKTRLLINRINDHIHSDQEWDAFEQQFKRVHSEFLRKLSEQFPLLTPTELKICALMKLNLSSKAIANLFCLSTRTVENHRQRIRKKLGLSNEENLGSYLTAL